MILYELTKLIRSKNAGPFMLTIDILFETEDALRKVISSNILNPSLIANIYSIQKEQVQSFLCWEARAIKFSFPRQVVAGDFEDSDVFGGQYHAPLVDIEIPIN
ncbi:DUF4387 domain-containing protein [Fredinandcohnia onubensis]|uniref:DUF4387 domain-containing protein n=1 Tax=Fredinandcohnia onubensis TaxID=1571209 RepID=UPI000C0BFBFD|nr:DUF4387 domain-containing protein [Fredinandcohnia onubensis]